MRHRSPFFGASKQDLKTYRACAQTVAAWKQAAVVGDFYHLDGWSDAPSDPRFLHAPVLMQTFISRGWRHLDKLPGARAFRDKDRLARIRQHSPEQYELIMLRKEVTELRGDLAASQVDGSKGRIPPKEWLSL